MSMLMMDHSKNQVSSPGGLSIHVENSVTASVSRLSDFIEKRHDTGEREYSAESYLSVLVH